MSLRHYTWRSMQQRPGRTILTVLSIVIGVTAAVAVGLGTATTRNAYKAMFAMVTGKTTLEVNAKGSSYFAESVLEKVSKVQGVKVAAPAIERGASMSFGDGKRTRLQVLGVDPKLDQQVRDYKFVTGRHVESGLEIAIDEGLATFLGLKIGDKVKLSGAGALGREYTIVGLFRLESGATLAQLGVALIPLESAKAQFYGRRGPQDAIDKIQLITEGNVDEAQRRIAAVLPADVEVHKPAASTQLMQETLLAAEQGLTLTTVFSLLMSAFIILNTFLMNVSERRRHLSILRAIGASRSQITRALIGEAFLLGLIGTAIGIATGVGLAFVGTQVIARAFDVQLPRLREVMTPQPFIIGANFGMLMALVGAAVPAWLAGRVSPLEGMNRLVRRATPNLTRLFVLAGTIQVVVAMAITFGCIYGYIPIEAATWCGPPLLIGLVMLDTVVLAPQVAAVSWLLRGLSRVEATLAQKQVLRNHMRSALTVGVLFIAGSTGVGMANSILDNVRDVHDWAAQAIVGDFFVRSMMPDMATGDAPDLPDEIGPELRQIQHIHIGGTNFFKARIPQPNEDPENPFQATIVSRELETAPRYDVISGDPETIGDQMRGGAVVVGSVLAQKLQLKVGDKLPIAAKSGVRQAPICAIANDYLVGGLSVHMYVKYAEEWLGAHGTDGFVVKLKEGQEQYRSEVQSQLEAIAKKYDAIVISQNDIVITINRFVQGTQWSLWLLVLMGFVVAAFGMVNTLTMNVLEQTRELGLLRIVAMTKKQVRRTIVMQALIIGGIGLPPGVLIGVAIAYILNMTMLPSFGHRIRFHTYPEMLAATLIGGMVIVVIAAWFPARRATRINVVEALHYE